jgi:hypothetical protein
MGRKKLDFSTTVVHLRIHPDLLRVIQAGAAEIGVSDATQIRTLLARHLLGGMLAGQHATEEEIEIEIEARWPGTTVTRALPGLPGLARAVAKASKGALSPAQALRALTREQ